jgi:hypothetical protein
MTTDPTASTSCTPPHGAHCSNSTQFPLRWIAAVFLSLSCFSSLSAQAQQDAPRLEFFGGYSYLRYDSKTIGFANTTGLNGWNFMAAYNLVRGFGVVAEASGDYGLHLNLRDVLFGPQVFYSRGRLTFFGHGLFGKARSFVAVGTGALDTGSAMEAGGGVDMDLNRHFAIRIVQADYLHTRLFQQPQNNLQFSTGLVYHWGRIKWKPRRPPGPMSP